MGLVAAFVVKLVFVSLPSLQAEIVSGLATFGQPWLVIFIVVFGLLICIPLATGRSAAFAGVRHFAKYPPLWVAVLWGALILGCLEGWCMAWPIRYERFGAVPLLLLFGATFLAVSAAGAVAALFPPTDEVARPHVPQQPLDQLSPKTLTNWLAADDEPITTPEQDLFNHRSIARRIARRLLESGPRLPTFVVLGRPGSGKTSLFNLVRHYSNHPAALGAMDVRGIEQTLRFTRISAWKYNDTESLIRGVLSAVIGQVHSIVDAYALTGIARSYVAAISSSGNAVASLAAFLAPSHRDPSDALRQVDRIAGTIGVKIIVWLDDLERFASADGVAPEPVRAVLAMFRECHHLTFVLADAGEGPQYGSV